MLRCAHDEEEEEQQRCEEEWRGEEEQGGEEEEVELEHLVRQTQSIHKVALPIAPTLEEDRVLIRQLGDR
jgi:hypothetical protein